MPGGIKIAGIIEGSKEYEDGWNYFARSKDGSVISFRSGKRHEKGKEIALYVPIEKINLVAPDGERLTDDDDIESEVHEGGRRSSTWLAAKKGRSSSTSSKATT